MGRARIWYTKADVRYDTGSSRTDSKAPVAARAKNCLTGSTCTSMSIPTLYNCFCNTIATRCRR